MVDAGQGEVLDNGELGIGAPSALLGNRGLRTGALLEEQEYGELGMNLISGAQDNWRLKASALPNAQRNRAAKRLRSAASRANPNLRRATASFTM